MAHRRRWPLFLIHWAAVLRGRRILILVLIPLALIIVGTLGYWLIEKDYTLFDALYMTVITLATIGYGEIPHALSIPGRVFTMVLILGGVFTLFYAAGEVIRVIVSGEVRELLGRQRMQRSLATITDHLIVCGYGRLGRLVCQEFSRQRLSFVVIEERPDLLAGFEMPGGIPLQGDASSDEMASSGHAGWSRSWPPTPTTCTRP
jgi:voltage-gated potassium channel